MFNNRLISTNISNNERYNEFLDSLKFDYSQIYRGTVVDNDDPLKLGRVKVRVPQIHGSESNTESDIYLPTFSIPWATSAVMVGAGNNTGSYLIPNIGDIVFVTFEGGKASYPIYFGGIVNKYKDKSTFIGTGDANASQLYDVSSDDFNTDITNGAQRVIYKSLKGATIIIDDSDRNESIKIIDQLGQIISMENESDEILQRDRDKTATGSLKFKKGKILLQNSSGSSIVLSGDEIYIKGTKVRIETDDFKIVNEESELSPENNLADDILDIGESTNVEPEPIPDEMSTLHNKLDEILDYRESDTDE